VAGSLRDSLALGSLAPQRPSASPHSCGVRHNDSVDQTGATAKKTSNIEPLAAMAFTPLRGGHVITNDTTLVACAARLHLLKPILSAFAVGVPVNVQQTNSSTSRDEQ